jgi:hypothetical protein
MLTRSLLLMLVLLTATPIVLAQNTPRHKPKSGTDPFAPKAQNARKLPPPKPVEIAAAYEPDKEQLARLDSAMWPHIEEAKETLKEVHKRWNKGLPKGDQLFVTVRVYDDKGNFEHVLGRVDKWVPNRLFTTVSSVLSTTKRYQPGQSMAFEQTIVVDWKIEHADGTVEGDRVRKFLEEYYAVQTGKGQ